VGTGIVFFTMSGSVAFQHVVDWRILLRAHNAHGGRDDGYAAELTSPAISEAERALARQLLALASAPLDWARYPDRSAEELAALIQAKIAQQPPAAPAEEPAVLNLLEALKQSVAQATQAETVAPTTAASPSRKPRARRKTG
jgi:non-homologous end joining protein Ku